MAHPGLLKTPATSFNARSMILAFVVATFVVAFLPFNQGSASATSAAITLPSTASLSLDGSAALATVGAPVAAVTAAATTAFSYIPSAMSDLGSTAITLGSPNTNAVALGSCSNFFFCVVAVVKDVVVGGVTCGAAGLTLFLFSTHTCLATSADLDSIFSSSSAWGLPSGITDTINQLNNQMASTAAGMSHWILVDELGTKNNFNSPTISCAIQNQPSSCHDSWILGQIAVMRSLGLYFIVPLIMLVVMQSLLKGSIYFLVRSVLIMLPVAVLGSMLLVGLAQLLMNVSDDMSYAIAQYTTHVSDYGDALKAEITQLSAHSFGLFTFLWLLLFVLAALFIFVELVLREVGVYLSILFLPFAFAMLVWPSATRYARRLAELLIGLIFSKVFIIGAFSLGYAAFGHTGAAAGTNAGGTISSDTAVVSSVMTGAVTLLMAGFAGGKILQLTPAAVGAAEGYVVKRENLTSRLTYFSIRMGGWSAKRQNKLAQAAQPGTNFRNGATALPAPTPGGPPPAPLPPPGPRRRVGP